MRVAIRFARWCAVVLLVLIGGMLSARVCLAQPTSEPAAAAHGEESAGNPNPLAIDLDLAVWTVIVFVVLLLVLSRFAWPQIVEALDERERHIAGNIAAAAAKNEEAKQLLVEYEARLAAAAGEVRALLEEARRDAEHTKGQIVEDGRKAAADELARALREIERAKDGAIEALARSSANVAIDLARKVVREDLRPDRQNQLVREALTMLAATKPSKN